MRFSFVEEHRKDLPVSRLCRVMDVSPRGCRVWRRRPLSNRQRKDMVVLAHIREQFHLSLRSHGRPRMTEELKELGLDVGHRRVIGWAVSNRKKRDLAIRALRMAVALRQPPKGCIHHTDRVSQYCPHDYQKILRQHGFKVSPLGECLHSPAGQCMSGKGNC